MKVLCVFGEFAYGDPARGEAYEHANFIPAFLAAGCEVELFDSFSRSIDRDFRALNERFIETVARFKPDVIFMTLMSYEIWTETLDLIRRTCPAVVINWGTDDSWKYDAVSRFLIPYVDLHVTTDGRAMDKAAREGFTNVVRSQWAAGEKWLRPPRPASECVHDVSFIGNVYGTRGRWIDALRRAGIDVACFGRGTPGGVVDTARMIDIINSSRITLNFSEEGIRGSMRPGRRGRQIKARLFEATGAGSCLLTQQADGLADYFGVGHEIDAFRTPEELIGKISSYLADPPRRDAMALSGYERTASAHTYERRFAELLAAADALRRRDDDRSWRLSPDDLAAAGERHRLSRPALLLRACLVGAAKLAMPDACVRRAVRRLVFEFSWRVLGARTFGARGLPGRLFFRES